MLKTLKLIDFRNFEKKVFDFASGTTIIVGQNAVGKTNVLESIYLVSTGKSFRARVEAEMIRNSQDIARVKANDDLEMVLTRGEITLVDGNKVRSNRKKMLVNGLPKRAIDFAGRIKTVLFAPSDIDIITGSPSGRRKFLDEALSQVDREYHRAWSSFEKGLRQRNKILFQIRENGISRSHLTFWDQLLIKNGDMVTNKRAEFVDFINRTESLNESKFNLIYDNSVISESRLKQYEKEEVMAATTLVGPHRDDFTVEINSRNLSTYGSRGEQRMGVLWLKLAQLKYIEYVSEEKPTLLLDDIFSELDHAHRQVVVDVIKNYQSILTTADPHYVEGLGGVVVNI